jgi:hypothetical protein
MVSIGNNLLKFFPMSMCMIKKMRLNQLNPKTMSKITFLIDCCCKKIGKEFIVEYFC